MDPATGMMVGAGISALGSLFGGSKSRDAADYQAAVNAQLQREFAQSGIQWRVSDAQKAGVHPLYAIGGSGATYSPAPIHVGDSGVGGALHEMGQGVSRAVAAQATSAQKALTELQIREVESRIGENDARAAYFRSQAVRPGVAQAGVGFPGGSGVVDTGAVTYPYVAVEEPGVMQLSPHDQYGAGFPGKYDMIKPKAVEIESVSADAPWNMAGPARAGLQRYRLTRNMELLLPYNQEGWTEGIESLPYVMYPMVYQANRDYYGDDVWRVIVQELGAQHPFARWVASQGSDERPTVYREGDYVGGTRAIRRGY